MLDLGTAQLMLTLNYFPKLLKHSDFQNLGIPISSENNYFSMSFYTLRSVSYKANIIQ